jgi:hypothetical protein
MIFIKLPVLWKKAKSEEEVEIDYEKLGMDPPKEDLDNDVKEAPFFVNPAFILGFNEHTKEGYSTLRMASTETYVVHLTVDKLNELLSTVRF